MTSSSAKTRAVAFLCLHRKGLLGVLAGLGMLYAVGVVIAAVLLIAENALVRADDLSKVNLAFFTVNGVVSMVLGGLAIADVLLH